MQDAWGFQQRKVLKLDAQRAPGQVKPTRKPDDVRKRRPSE
jgi:hypothetical protein